MAQEFMENFGQSEKQNNQEGRGARRLYRSS